MKLFTSVAAAAAVVALSATQAEANPVLVLQSGATTTTIVGSAGVASHFQLNFAGWAIVIDSGVAAPADGAPGDNLDLSAQDVTGANAAALTILFSAGTYAGPASAVATVNDANVATGDVFTTYYGPALLSTANVLTAPLVSGTSTGTLPSAGGPYYLTEKVVLGPGTAAGQVDSLDAELALNVPDGGLTAILLGGAMAGLTLFRPRNNKK